MNILTEDSSKHAPATKYPKWIALLDARERSARAQKLYSDIDLEIAVLSRTLARKVFTRSTVYLNFRERFVAIKVSAPQRADMITPEFQLLENRMAALGATVLKTRTSRIYRMLER
jgi:hypothetical protein